MLKNKKNEYKKKIFDEKKSEDVNDIRERVEESDEERKEVIRWFICVKYEKKEKNIIMWGFLERRLL